MLACTYKDSNTSIVDLRSWGQTTAIHVSIWELWPYLHFVRI